VVSKVHLVSTEETACSVSKVKRVTKALLELLV
jgi:hypothetical protein